MNDKSLSTSGKAFQKFISHITQQLTRPKTKLSRQLLCGVLFSNNLILTNIAAKVHCLGRLTAIAKRLRRQLADGKSYIKQLWYNYLSLLRRRLDADSLFILDLSDLAKPYAMKMENLAVVHDGVQACLVTESGCMQLYCLDNVRIIWPALLWPYSLEAQGQLSQNAQILKILSLLAQHFGEGFGIYVFDRGFDSSNLIEPCLASKRHFIIRQRGDRTAVLENGVHMLLRDLVEHLFAASGNWLVYKKLHLPALDKPLYVVAYRTLGSDQPIILLTALVVESSCLALQIRNRFTRRWDCETSIEFLKSKIGIERFAVRRYKSIQRLIFLAGLALGFLSFLQSRCKDIRQRINDKLGYSRELKGFWFYRLLISLHDALSSRAAMSLSAWCRPPP
jgi:hypothetical protein